MSSIFGSRSKSDAPAADASEREKIRAYGPKYRSFRDDVFATLREFERAKEWPDLIKALLKLQRTLDRYAQFPTIPHKLLFSKRVAQVLNAQLPAGVHFKALDLLGSVLARIGSDGLAGELHLWCPALFALFKDAATNVKPRVLELFETHLLPLRRLVIPGLPGLVLGLLPGMEDSGGEFYEPVLQLLDRFCSSTSVPAFYQALWRALLVSPHVRMAAVNFLQQRLPRDRTAAQLAPYLPLHNTLVLHALGKVLADPNGLVQRQALELLNTHFPLDNGPFDAAARTKLVGLAIPVLRRREVSLTRRLTSWLVGAPSADAPEAKAYFERHGRQPTIDAVRAAFAVDPEHAVRASETGRDASTSEMRGASASAASSVQGRAHAKALSEAACRPLRILMFLLDTPEIGDSIIDDLMVDALRYLNRYKDGYAYSHDVMRSMNLVIDQLQPHMLWNFMCTLFESDLALSNAPHDAAAAPNASDEDKVARRAELALPLVDSLLDILPSEALYGSATQKTHLPALLCAVTRALQALVRDRQRMQPLIAALTLTLKIVGKLYSLRRAHSAQVLDNSASDDKALAAAQHNADVQRKSLRGALSSFHEYTLMLVASHAALRPPDRIEAGSDTKLSPSLLRAFDMTCQLLTSFDSALPLDADRHKAAESAPPSVGEAWPRWFDCIAASGRAEQPRVACVGARACVALVAGASSQHDDDEPAVSASLPTAVRTAAIDDADLLPRVAERLWELLEPAEVAVHYQLADVMMQLSMLPRDFVTPIVAKALASSDSEVREVGHQRFALLWRLSGELGGPCRFAPANLFAMLDALNDEQPSVRLTGQSWLADSISRVERILDPLLRVLLADDTKRQTNLYVGEYDATRVLYVFRKLKLIIDCDFQLFMRQVSTQSVNAELVRLHLAHERGNRQAPRVYVQSDDDESVRASGAADADADAEVAEAMMGVAATTIIDADKNSGDKEEDADADVDDRVVAEAASAKDAQAADDSKAVDDAQDADDGAVAGAADKQQDAPIGDQVADVAEESKAKAEGEAKVEGDDNNDAEGEPQANADKAPAQEAAPVLQDDPAAQAMCRSYLDFLAHTALAFIQGQTDERHPPLFRERNAIVQTAAAEFLQYLLAKITQPERARQVALATRSAVLRVLARAVSTQSLVLQVHLLGVLRAVVVYSNALQEGDDDASGAERGKRGGKRGSSGNDARSASTSSHNAVLDAEDAAMLLQTLMIGLLQPPIKNIRFHWLEFVTASLPYLGDALTDIVVPVVQCLCGLLDSFETAYDSLSSKDILLLLHALAGILDFTLFGAGSLTRRASERTARSKSTGRRNIVETAVYGVVDVTVVMPVRAIGGLVKDVFGSSDAPELAIEPQQRASKATRQALLRNLGVVLSSLINVWQKGTASGIDGSHSAAAAFDGDAAQAASGSFTPDEVHNKYAIQDQIIGILDPLSSRYPRDMVGSLLDLWQLSPTAAADRAAVGVESSLFNRTATDLLNQLSSRSPVFEAALQHMRKAAEQEISAVSESVSVAAPAEPPAHLGSSGSSAGVGADEAGSDGSQSGSRHNSWSSALAAANAGADDDDVAGAARRSESPIGSSARASPLLSSAANEPLTRQLAAADFVSCFVEHCVDTGTLRDGWQSLALAVRTALSLAHVSCYPLLVRCLYFYVRRVSLERYKDFRASVRKDLQDVTQRVLERCFMLAGRETRSAAPAEWRLSMPSLAALDESLSAQAGAAPSPQLRPRRNREKRASMSAFPVAAARHDADKPMRTDATTLLRLEARNEALRALAEMLAPLIDSAFDESKDKAVTLVSASIGRIVVHLRGPRGRNSSSSLAADMSRREALLASVSLLASLTNYGYLLRAYRREVLDVFYRADFFRMLNGAHADWLRVIDHVMSRDKTALAEFLKRVAKSLTPSQAIGASSLLSGSATRSRELDISRARFVKQLAFILYAGVRDQHASVLPSIQERLVEALRMPKSPRLHNEVFLCFRILLLRFSGSKLAAFWPVILTELVRIFSLEQPDPNLLLAAAKFLDLALVLPTDSFPYCEWVFVADRLDESMSAAPSVRASSDSAFASGGDDDAAAAAHAAELAAESGVAESCAPLNFARADDVKFTPFISQLCESVPEEAPVAAAAGDENGAPRAADSDAAVAAFVSESSIDGLQRPVILARSMSDFASDGGYDAFVRFLRRFREQANRWRLSGQPADMQYVERSFRTDFTEA